MRALLRGTTADMHSILLVEDEEIIRRSLRKLLERNGYTVCESVSVKAARESFNLRDFALIISDLRLPGDPGTDLIGLAGSVPVLIMTSYASLRSAVDTMRLGAVDYISKPFSQADMLAAVKRVIQNSGARNDRALTADCSELLGSASSLGMRRLCEVIHKVAPSNAAVLIQGETGTGKELTARAIHEKSRQAGQTFLSINCARVSCAEFVQLVDEAPANASVFLDNVAELPVALQPDLIEFIKRDQHRIISATDKDLQCLCQTGEFRSDLYFRISVVKLQVPPLREREQDILELAERFLTEFSPESPNRLSAEAEQALLSHHWPGNVLELRNVLQQAAIIAGPGETISQSLLDCHMKQGEIRTYSSTPVQPTPGQDQPEALSLEDYFTHFVLENQDCMSETELAKRLGISRKCLWERRQKLGIARKKAN